MMRWRVDVDDKIERQILGLFLTEGRAITSSFLCSTLFSSFCPSPLQYFSFRLPRCQCFYALAFHTLFQRIISIPKVSHVNHNLRRDVAKRQISPFQNTGVCFRIRNFHRKQKVTQPVSGISNGLTMRLSTSQIALAVNITAHSPCCLSKIIKI